MAGSQAKAAEPGPVVKVARFDRGQITNLLTLIIVVVWTATAVVRIWVPWPEAGILDAAMPVVIGYWFASSAIAKKNGNGTSRPASENGVV